MNQYMHVINGRASVNPADLSIITPNNIDLQEAIGNKAHIEIGEVLLFQRCRITLSIDRRD